MDKEMLNALMDAVENYGKRLDKTEVKTTKMNDDIGNISKSLHTSIKDVVTKEVAKVPKPENANYELMKRLMSVDIEKFMASTYKEFFGETKSNAESYIDSKQPTSKEVEAMAVKYVESIKKQLIGAIGPKGDKGDSIVGPKGPKGDTGPKGSTGEKGPKGDIGKSPVVDDISFKDGKLVFTVAGKSMEVPLPIPKGYGSGSGGSKTAAKLLELRDVSLGGLKAGDTLVYNGNKWENIVNPVSSKADKVGSEDIEITDPTKGYILRSPDDKRWRITINNSGNLTTTEVL